MIRPLIFALALTACGSVDNATDDDSAGAQLETAAMRAGLVIDPAQATLVGAWTRDTDRACVIDRGSGTYGIGVRIDYGPGQECSAAGSATRAGNKVRVEFGTCSFDARFDGDRLIFPAEVPDTCERLCTGRASLAAMTVDHLSTSPSEAATLRGPNGDPLCPG